jgi:hypothetical protein
LVTRLLALAEQRAGDPWIGLHAGEHAEPRGPLQADTPWNTYSWGS